MAEKIEANRKWRTVNQRETPRDGATALENWGHWMAERRNIHSRLSNKLGVSPRDLLMNSDEFRKRKILHKAVFERAKEPLTYDKYRGSPNFWVIPEGLSERIIPKGKPKYCAESDAGITSEEKRLPTIGPSSRGKKFDYKNPEYLGTPKNILTEKGIDVRDISEHMRKNEDERWIESPYLQQKIKKLPKKF